MTTETFSLPLRTLHTRMLDASTLFMTMLVTALGYTAAPLSLTRSGKSVNSRETRSNGIDQDPKCVVDYNDMTGEFAVYAYGRTQEQIKTAMTTIEGCPEYRKGRLAEVEAELAEVLHAEEIGDPGFHPSSLEAAQEKVRVARMAS